MEDSPKLAVLIVEDDALIRALAVDIVEDAGYLPLELQMRTKQLPCSKAAPTSRCFSPTSICPEAWTA